MITPEQQEKWRKAVEAHYEYVKKVGKFVKEFGVDGEWVEDEYEYSESAAEIVDMLCQSLEEQEGMTIPADQYDGPVMDNWAYVWTDKAQKLIDYEVSIWEDIGYKYWPDGDIDIKRHLNGYGEI